MKISSDEKIIMQRIQGILLAESKTMSEIISEYKNQFGISLNPIVLERILKRTLIQEIGKDQLTQKFFLKRNKNEKKLMEIKEFNDLFEAISLKNEYYKKFTFHELKNGSGRKLFEMCQDRIVKCLTKCYDVLAKLDAKTKEKIIENLPEEIKYIFNSTSKNDNELVEDINIDLEQCSSSLSSATESFDFEESQKKILNYETKNNFSEFDDIELFLTKKGIIPENRSFRESLIFPIKYKEFPSVFFIQENNTHFFSTFKTFWTSNISNNTKTLDELLFAIKSNTFVINEVALLNWLIYLIKQNAQLLEESDELNILNKYLQNPYFYFFDIIDRKIENISFAIEHPEFNKILREVCRDNTITPNEREFLFRKAQNYFIDEQLLEQYLNNPFIGYESFKIIVDQVCSDLELSKDGEKYLIEKAHDYKVPKNVLDEMIGLALVRAALVNRLSQNEEFYQIILIFLFANSFKIESINRIAKMKILNKSFSQDFRLNPRKILDLMFEELQLKISDKNHYFLNLKNVADYLDLLGLNYKNYTEAFQIFRDQQEKGIKTTHPSEKTIVIENEVYQIKFENHPFQPFFYNKYDPIEGNYQIVINENHNLFDPKSIDLIKNIAVSIIHAKLSMTGKESDIFMNRINHYLNIIQ